MRSETRPSTSTSIRRFKGGGPGDEANIAKECRWLHVLDSGHYQCIVAHATIKGFDQFRVFVHAGIQGLSLA